MDDVAELVAHHQRDRDVRGVARVQERLPDLDDSATGLAIDHLADRDVARSRIPEMVSVV
jgi:hypothetical protein